MLANLVSSLIKHKRVTTTLAKAKAARPVAEKLLTLGKLANEALATASSTSDAASKAQAIAANVHNRRLVAARLRQQARSHFKGTPTTKGKELREAWKQEHDVVHILCDTIAPAFMSRKGGYTRILRLGQRQGDAGQVAILEWVDFTAAAETAAPAPTA
jgi:large subunit ribosomal protein L17